MKKQTTIKQWINYLKENPKGYWFKRKLYGWGWVPVTWQGWSIMILFFIYLIGIAKEIEKTGETGIGGFFTKLIVSIVILLFICYKTGEKPKWQWGITKKKK